MEVSSEIKKTLAWLARTRQHCLLVDVGRTSLTGAEGATAPETLRQTDQRRYENSGERHMFCVRRRDSNLRQTDRGGITREGNCLCGHVVPYDISNIWTAKLKEAVDV